MELGCKDLDFNEAVLNFALAQRSQGRRTAIVTANMDVFSDVVVPAHRLDEKFDVIINSSDTENSISAYSGPLHLRHWEMIFTMEIVS